MENLSIYNSLKSVPSEFLKTIAAGRLKGMSDIKPQWRILKLTEIFGACGFGWKIQNLKFDYRNVGDEVVVNCYLEFLYKNSNNEWSEPIPGIGGSNFSTFENKTDYDTQKKERTLYVSDEAEKMAYTDAISVATKMIGLAGDVYIGHGGKYDSKEPLPPTAPKNDENKDKTIWLTKEQYDIAIKSDAKAVNAVITKYSVKPYAMKKEFKTALENRLLELVNNKK